VPEKTQPTPVSLWRVTQAAVHAYIDGDRFTLGAALAFYTVFSIAPLLILVMAAAGLVFGREAVEGHIAAQIEGMIGHDGAAQIETMIKSTARPGASTWPAVLSTGLLLIGATSVFVQLRKSLDIIWQVKTPQRAGYVKFLLDRTFSFAMVVCLSFLLLVSLVIHAGLLGLSSWVERYVTRDTVLLFRGIELGISFGMTTLLISIVYRFLSDAKVRWRDACVGGLFTAVLFTVGKYAIGTYLGLAGIADAFGVAGSIVVLLLWVYYSSQIVFFGAEFTRAFAAARGSNVVPGRAADPPP
jgi:membrane protein